MDKFKAFLSDKKNTPIVGAVAGIVLVLVVLFYLKQFGIIGGGAVDQNMDMSTDSTMTQTAPTDTSTTAAPGAPTDMSGAAPSTTSATPAAAPQGSVDKIPPMFAYRKDPFMGFGGVPKKKDAMMAILPSIRHIRLAPASVKPSVEQVQADEPLPPQPMRRVAGIMWGSTVKAIIESGGKTYVVVPGQTIPDERVRVDSIEPSGVILSTLDTKRPMQIRVNLAGSPSAQDQANTNNTGDMPPSTGNYGGRRGGGSRYTPVEGPPPGM